jgi:uncharacterized protein (DUF1330 family)
LAAYVVVDIDITDLEGSWQPKGITILEFPTVEQAQQWHAAPEYQEPKALRQRAATCHAILVAGH